MKNMYMTPLRYKNFNDVQKDTKLHFHITPREFADWMVENNDLAIELTEKFTEIQPQLESNPDGEATTEQKLTMLRLVKILAELSYGKPSEDGEVFDKSDNKKFAYSAAYDAFRLFLFENPKELVTFLETLMNEEVIAEFSSRLASAGEQAEGHPSDSAGTPVRPLEAKKPSEMSREELLAAYQNKNQQ